jgi:hypothetical protein
MLGRDEPELGRDQPELGRGRGELGRLTPAPRDVLDLGRWTLLVRDGLTRGWLTMALLALDRGTDLVSVGPPPERPTALVAAVELGGRWTTVVLAGVVRTRLTESMRLVLGPVRVMVPVRVLGARATVPVRLLGARVTGWVRVGPVCARPTEPVGLTMPRLERTAGGLARTVVGR